VTGAGLGRKQYGARADCKGLGGGCELEVRGCGMGLKFASAGKGGGGCELEVRGCGMGLKFASAGKGADKKVQPAQDSYRCSRIVKHLSPKIS